MDGLLFWFVISVITSGGGMESVSTEIIIENRDEMSSKVCSIFAGPSDLFDLLEDKNTFFRDSTSFDADSSFRHNKVFHAKWAHPDDKCGD